MVSRDIWVRMPLPRNCSGPSVKFSPAKNIWLYLPGRGRYVLSLAPRLGLDFKQSGEVRGGAITFAVDGDSIRLESFIPFAAGDTPYLLYVLHDPQWEPTSEKQKGAPNIGTVGAAELSALK